MAKIVSVEVLQVDLAPKVKRSDAIQSFQCQETPMVRVPTPQDGASAPPFSSTSLLPLLFLQTQARIPALFFPFPPRPCTLTRSPYRHCLGALGLPRKTSPFTVLPARPGSHTTTPKADRSTSRAPARGTRPGQGARSRTNPPLPPSTPRFGRACRSARIKHPTNHTLTQSARPLSNDTGMIDPTSHPPPPPSHPPRTHTPLHAPPLLPNHPPLPLHMSPLPPSPYPSPPPPHLHTTKHMSSTAGCIRANNLFSDG